MRVVEAELFYIGRPRKVSEKVAFEQRSKGKKKEMHITGENIPDEKKSKHSPEV